MKLPPWVPGDEHDWKPAPEPLLLVQAFVNTKDLERGTDLLAEVETGNGWLRLSGLLPPDAASGPEDLGAARDVRECVRALIAHNGGGPEPTDQDLGPLHALARSAHPRLAIGPAGLVQIEPGPDGRVADGLVRLLVIIRDAQRDGTWPRLKACGNAECGWAFYDRSHGRRGTWCDMASCGNLIKNRNLRARRGARAG
ncbi:MAG TPA: CGNR zinc finger domain-containing protein [Streptosporangiaceae bacterium]|nr:CGNR zinc finger domain-containing protein [Streptosporangiaceae bacterium]